MATNIGKFNNKAKKYMNDRLHCNVQCKPESYLHVVLASDTETRDLYWAVYVWDTREVIEEGKVSVDRPTMYNAVGIPDTLTQVYDTHEPIKSKQKELNMLMQAAYYSTYAVHERLNKEWNALLQKHGITNRKERDAAIANDANMRDKLVKARIQWLQHFGDIIAKNNPDAYNRGKLSFKDELQQCIDNLQNAAKSNDIKSIQAWIWRVPVLS